MKNILFVLDAFNKTFSSIWGIVKTIWYALSFFLFQYLMIPEEALYMLLILMAVDMGCGILKTYRIQWGQYITSHKWTMGLIKKWIILIIIFTIAVYSKLLGIDPIKFLVWLVAIFWAAETYSIIGNGYAAYTLKIMSEYDATSEVIKWIGRVIVARIEKVTKSNTIKDTPPSSNLD